MQYPTDMFWRKKWVGALIMLPMGLAVALLSARYANEWWFLSVVVGLVLIELTYRKVMLNSNGVFGGAPKIKIAICLFGAQVILLVLLGVIASSQGG